MAAKLELTFRQTARGLEVQSNLPLHRRTHDVIYLKRGALSSCSAALDDRDGPLVHALAPLLEEVDVVADPLLVHRFKLSVELVRGCARALEILETIKERLIETCHRCGLYNVVLISG